MANQLYQVQHGLYLLDCLQLQAHEDEKFTGKLPKDVLLAQGRTILYCQCHEYDKFLKPIGEISIDPTCKDQVGDELALLVSNCRFLNDLLALFESLFYLGGTSLFLLLWDILNACDVLDELLHDDFEQACDPVVGLALEGKNECGEQCLALFDVHLLIYNGPDEVLGVGHQLAQAVQFIFDCSLDQAIGNADEALGDLLILRVDEVCEERDVERVDASVFIVHFIIFLALIQCFPLNALTKLGDTVLIDFAQYVRLLFLNSIERNRITDFFKDVLLLQNLHDGLFRGVGGDIEQYGEDVVFEDFFVYCEVQFFGEVLLQAIPDCLAVCEAEGQEFPQYLDDFVCVFQINRGDGFVVESSNNFEEGVCWDEAEYLRQAEIPQSKYSNLFIIFVQSFPCLFGYHVFDHFKEINKDHQHPVEAILVGVIALQEDYFCQHLEVISQAISIHLHQCIYIVVTEHYLVCLSPLIPLAHLL